MGLQEHLDDNQKEDLERLFMKYKGLFKGKVGKYTGEPAKLQLKEGADPFKIKRAYGIPQAIKQTVKDEVSRMEQHGTMSLSKGGEWGAPSFTVAKKDNYI